MKFTAHQHLKVVQSLPPASRTAVAATTGIGIDCKGFDELLVIVNADRNGMFRSTIVSKDREVERHLASLLFAVNGEWSSVFHRDLTVELNSASCGP